MEDNKESIVTREELQACMDKVSQELWGVPSPIIVMDDTDTEGAEIAIEMLRTNVSVEELAAHNYLVNETVEKVITESEALELEARLDSAEQVFNTPTLKRGTPEWDAYMAPAYAALKVRLEAEAKKELEAEARYAALLAKPMKTVEDIAIILAHEIDKEADGWSHLNDEEDEMTWVAVDGGIGTLSIVNNLVALGIIKVGE